MQCKTLWIKPSAKSKHRCAVLTNQQKASSQRASPTIYTWLKCQRIIVEAGIWIVTGVIVLSPSPGYLSQLKCIMSKWQKLDSLMEVLLVWKPSHQYRWSFPMSPVAKWLQGKRNSREGDVMKWDIFNFLALVFPLPDTKTVSSHRASYHMGKLLNKLWAE